MKLKKEHLSVFWGTALLTILILPVTAQAQTELLQNGSADANTVDNGDGVPQDWVEDTGTGHDNDWAANSPDTYSLGFSAQDGSNVFVPWSGDNSSNSHIWELSQTIDVSSDATAIDNGNASVDFSGYIRSKSGTGDLGKIQIEYKDGGGAVIGTYDSGWINEEGAWHNLTDSRTVPSDTREITITLLGDNTGTGSGPNEPTYVDATFDNLSLTMTIANTAPTTANNDVFMVTDTEFAFSDTDFPFSDSDGGDALNAVDITTLPGSGTLYLDANDNDTNDGEDVSAGDDISVSDLQNGDLRYVPPTDNTGYQAVSFTFKVSDGTDFSSSASTMNITIDANEVTISGTSGQDAWHFIAKPYQSNLSDLFSKIWTQGATNSDAPGGNPNIFTFDESIPDFSAFTGDLNTTPTAGSGYAVYMYADDDYESTGLDGDWPKTLSTSGNTHNVPVSIAVSNTDQNSNTTTDGDEGWNLIGNPFGTKIAVDNIINELQNVDAAANTNVYTYQNGSYQTLAFDDLKTVDPFQAFFVRVETSGTSGNLNLDNNDRSKQLSLKEMNNSELIFTLNGKKGLKGKGGFVFNQEASEKNDPYDGYQLWALPGSQYAMIYSRVGDQNIMSNHLPSRIEETKTYPLFVQTSATGTLSLNWERTDLPANWKFILHDLKTGEKFELGNRESYKFTVQSGQSKVASKRGNKSAPKISSTQRGEDPRFELTMTTDKLASNKEEEIPEDFRLEQNYPNPFNPATKIEYTVPSRSSVTLDVYNLAGKKVARLVNETMSAGNYDITWNAEQISSGIYIYRLKTADRTLTKKMTLIK